MDRGFDAGGAAVPVVNGNVNDDVDVDVNASARREMSPVAVPVGRGEPTVAGAGTGEGMILPPQSERWFSGIFRAIPSTERIRSFVRTPEMVIFLLGLANLISLIILIFNVITMKSFWPLTVAVFFSAGGYCALLIQRLRHLNLANQVLVEYMEARRASTSNRVIPREERRLLFHYFTLRPSTPIDNAVSCADAPSGASTPSGDGDGRGAESFSQTLDQSSSDSDEVGSTQGSHPLNATIPSRDGPLGEVHIDDWLDRAAHNWCPVCKKSVLSDDQD